MTVSVSPGANGVPGPTGTVSLISAPTPPAPWAPYELPPAASVPPAPLAITFTEVVYCGIVRV
jgi:hypothetical protein